MEFLILRTLSPKTGYDFFEGGERWGMGGVSKVCGQKAPSSGEAHRCHNKPQSNGNAAGCRLFGRRFESFSGNCHWRCRRHFPPQGGLLLDPCVHRAYFWVLFIIQIQNA